MNIHDVPDEELSLWIMKKLGMATEQPCHLGCGEMHPVEVKNAINDPAMTLLLLEKMQQMYCERKIGSFSLRPWVHRTGDWVVDLYISENKNPIKKIGRATAEAFALLNGWPQ